MFLQYKMSSWLSKYSNEMEIGVYHNCNYFLISKHFRFVFCFQSLVWVGLHNSCRNVVLFSREAFSHLFNLQPWWYSRGRSWGPVLQVSFSSVRSIASTSCCQNREVGQTCPWRTEGFPSTTCKDVTLVLNKLPSFRKIEEYLVFFGLNDYKK